MVVRTQLLLAALCAILLGEYDSSALTIPEVGSNSYNRRRKRISTETTNTIAAGVADTVSTKKSSILMTNEDFPEPSTFREAEVLGLRLMQNGNFEDALVAFQKGMKLPGSRPDVVRTRSTGGPSPVGGAYGGTDSQRVLLLDDFELQALYYNMACAHSRLGNISESVANLENAFKIGFTNFATVRGDPDLDLIKQDPDFEKLMNTYDENSNDDGSFNPFGIFSSKKK